MTAHSLQQAIDAALARLATVDRTDPACMFDCLVEVELLARDAVSEHGVEELVVRTTGMQAAERVFGKAA